MKIIDQLKNNELYSGLGWLLMAAFNFIVISRTDGTILELMVTIVALVYLLGQFIYDLKARKLDQEDDDELSLKIKYEAAYMTRTQMLSLLMLVYPITLFTEIKILGSGLLSLTIGVFKCLYYFNYKKLDNEDTLC